jgi:predicted membrane-bound dolichyl-phosphate-mannose-protein mannosyltransferase
MALRIKISPTVATKEGASKLPKRKGKLLREYVYAPYAKSRIRDVAARITEQEIRPAKPKKLEYVKTVKPKKINVEKIFEEVNKNKDNLLNINKKTYEKRSKPFETSQKNEKKIQTEKTWGKRMRQKR